jgi:hypothetical protein
MWHKTAQQPVFCLLLKLAAFPRLVYVWQADKWLFCVHSRYYLPCRVTKYVDGSWERHHNEQANHWTSVPAYVYQIDLSCQKVCQLLGSLYNAQLLTHLSNIPVVGTRLEKVISARTANFLLSGQKVLPRDLRKRWQRREVTHPNMGWVQKYIFILHTSKWTVSHHGVIFRCS